MLKCLLSTDILLKMRLKHVLFLADTAILAVSLISRPTLKTEQKEQKQWHFTTLPFLN